MTLRISALLLALLFVAGPAANAENEVLCADLANKIRRLREDLTCQHERKKAESDLGDAIKDYKCKSGQEKSCQREGH